MKNKKKSNLNPNIFRILLISLGHMCHDVYTSFLSPILPLLIEKFSLSYSSAGFISVVLRLPALLNPVIGACADRFNLKYAVILTPTVTALAMSLIGSAPNYSIILILALITGISSSFFHVPTPVLLKKFAGNRTGAAMSSFMIGGELSRTLGPFLILGAVSLWKLEGTWRLAPIGLLMSLIFYWNFKDIPYETKKSINSIRGSITETFNSSRNLFISIAGMQLARSCSATMLSAYLPSYLTAKGESLWFSGISLSILQASAVIGVLVTGTLSDRFGSKKLLICLFTAVPAGMLLFHFATGFLFIVSLIFLGFTAFSSTPVFLALIQRKGFKYPSVANGTFMTINFILSSSAILIGGRLSDVAGIESAFLICGIASVAGLPFAFYLKQE